MDRDIAAVRRFTRFYTRQIDLLNEGLLRSPFGLTEARILYELAQRETTAASQLGRDLGLDAGYVSRILKSFEAAGLLRRTPCPTDGRQVLLSLTPSGTAATATLDRSSNKQVADMLCGLSIEARHRLMGAMETVERCLTEPSDTETSIVLREHRTGDLGWIARRQGLLYAQEYGWDETFEALVAEIAAAFVRNRDAACERAWIAERRGEIVGSVFLMRDTDIVAKLRLLYVEPWVRGSGLGRRLVRECVEFARSRGYATLTLWTNDILVAARTIYREAGFVLVGEERHRSFGQDLVGQNWSLDLTAPDRTERGLTGRSSRSPTSDSSGGSGSS